MNIQIILLFCIFLVISLVIFREILRKPNLKEGLLWFFGRSLAKKTEILPYTITIIIPAYNEEKNIAKTIKGVLNQTVKVDRVIVVDDGSADKTAEIAKEMGVEVITNEKNLGSKAKAFNRALTEVTTDLVINVDADAVLDQKALEKALPYLADKEVGAVCGFVCPQEIKTFWERGRFVEYLFSMSVHKGAQNHWGAVIVSSGCFTIFKTEEIKKLGGFPERTITEDMDLTWLLTLKGKKVIYVPEAICYPLDPPDWKTYRRQVLRWLRGWLQNLTLYKWELKKAPRLMAFNFWYLATNFGAPFGRICFIFASIFYPWLLIFWGVEFLLVGLVCLAKAKRIGKFWKALTCFPLFIFMDLCNTYLFCLAVYYEWIKRRKLVVWEKGH